MIVEFIQKKTLNDKSKEISFNTQLRSSTDILKDLVSNPSFTYSNPFTPKNPFARNEEITIRKINGFLKSAALDLTTINDLGNFILAESKSLNDVLSYKTQALQYYVDMLNNNNLTQDITSFTDTFKTTEYINLSLSNVDIDNSVGQITLAKQLQANIIPIKNISISNYIIPTGVDTLGTQPSNIFDGKDSTSWLLNYVSDSLPASVLELAFPLTDVSSIVLSPVNNCKIKVSLYSQNQWVQVLNTELNIKQEFYIYSTDTQNFRIEISPIGGSFPRVCGLKELLLYNNTFSTSGTMFTAQITPEVDYNQLEVDFKSTQPEDSNIVCSYSNDITGPWTRLENGAWYTNANSDVSNVLFTSNNLQQMDIYQGLYSYPVPVKRSELYEGSLKLGDRQMKVDCYYQDLKELGYKYKILSPNLFQTNTTRFAYQDIPTYGFNLDSPIIQKNTELQVVNTTALGPNGSSLVFQRKVNDNVYPKLTDNKYKEMCFVLQSESTNQHIYQYNQQYKFTFYVYSNTDVLYTNAKYWFLQGFRIAGNKPFSSLDKVYGTFSLWINDTLVVSSDKPKTIYDDSTLEPGAIDGQEFNLILVKGLNKIEYMVNTTDNKIYDVSTYDTNLGPYLQFTMTPSLFDESINNYGDFSIDSIYCEPITDPKDEFDMLWNLSSAPTNWGWSSDRSYLLFNYKPLQPIDGYFKGSPLTYRLNYKNFNNTNRNPLFLKWDLTASASKVTPVLEEYTLSVR